MTNNIQCLYDPLATYLSPQGQDPPGSGDNVMTGFRVDKFYCPSRSTWGRFIFFFSSVQAQQRLLPVCLDSVAFPLPNPNYTPDLLITLNFTGIGLQVSNDSYRHSVQIMIGLTNDSHTVVERTIGTTILPGVNLVGVITWDLRQVLKNPRLSALGSLFDVSIMLALNLCLLLTTVLFFFLVL